MSEPITRRKALTLGALGIGAIAAGATGLVVTQSSDDTTVGDPGEAWIEPPVLTSENGVLEMDLDVAETDVTVGGATVRMLTYNGSVPGPTLHLRPGDRLRVHLRNSLDRPTNLHTHGLSVSATGNSDNPFLRIGPGGTFDYEIDLPDDHPSGVCWYHPHHHGTVAAQLFGGLYGAIIVDTEDWATAAPRVVIVSDTTITDGRVADVSQMDRMAGRTGESLLTNGRIGPVLRAPAGSSERLLLINACSSRYLDLQLGGFDAQVRGRDSTRLPSPAATDRLLLAPGNRADVVVTVGSSSADLIAAAFDRGQMGMGMMGGQSTTAPEATVLSVVPDAQAPAPVVAEVAPTPLPDLRSRATVATRTLTMSMGGLAGGGGGMGGGGMGMRFVIDGQAFDPDRIDQSVRIGTVEEWTIVNQSPMNHPFHLHIWPMQLIRAAGADISGVEFRDVIDVPARQSVTVRIAFDRFPGNTVYHCHILDHEDLGMMGVVQAR
ncbi:MULTISPECIES: multicopper oxidase family protein [Gordonia]|uniref:Multicopper oxidase family protein n=1 Tax=Gordonia tangerina TaxID=2911060 RepID=A0ABS9DQ44_9ACTN|nr:multicopper oxidase family protein [Gordonia tangerina]MCF3941344.1 multicopper oxidase family protein [Gordonia tangerina]